MADWLQYAHLFSRVIKVTREFEGRVNFAVSDKDDFLSELEALGITEKNQPSAGIYDSKGKYVMEDQFTVDNLKKFVQSYLDNELETYLKSEPVPEPNDGPVKVCLRAFYYYHHNWYIILYYIILF